MERFCYRKALDEIGVSYVGGMESHKLELSGKAGTYTYGVYLAPADMSGYNVCPKSEHCREHCLSSSGHNKIAELSHGVDGSPINRARIRRTQALFRKRGLFVNVLKHEIRAKRRYAERKNMAFAVRLNCVSDLSPEIMRGDDGKNILETFPDVQFYDYTKVPSRIRLMQKYDNYDLTFSYDGYNWDECEKFLRAGGKVAVVFANQKCLPKSFHGYPVTDGNRYDMRYLDPAGHIIGLTYHSTSRDMVPGTDGKTHFVIPDTPFVVKDTDPFVEVA